MLVSKSRSYSACSLDRLDVSATMGIRSYLVSFFHLSSAFLQRKGCRLLLAFCWIFGLIGGMGLCRAADPSFLSRMRGVCFCPVSISRLIAFTLLPFLFSALAVFASHPGFLCGIAFVRGFVLSFVTMVISLSWGSAGWLARWLLCFGSLLSAPLLYGYWLHHIGRHQPFSLWKTALFFTAAGILGSCHSFIFVPFLARVIHS